MVPELTDDDRRELLAEHGVEPWEIGNFVEMPREVHCNDCGGDFTAVHFEPDAIDDDDE